MLTWINLQNRIYVVHRVFVMEALEEVKVYDNKLTFLSLSLVLYYYYHHFFQLKNVPPQPLPQPLPLRMLHQHLSAPHRQSRRKAVWYPSLLAALLVDWSSLSSLATSLDVVGTGVTASCKWPHGRIPEMSGSKMLWCVRNANKALAWWNEAHVAWNIPTRSNMSQVIWRKKINVKSSVPLRNMAFSVAQMSTKLTLRVSFLWENLINIIIFL